MLTPLDTDTAGALSASPPLPQNDGGGDGAGELREAMGDVSSDHAFRSSRRLDCTRLRVYMTAPVHTCQLAAHTQR